MLLAGWLRGAAEAERRTKMMVCLACPDVCWDGPSRRCLWCGAEGQPGVLPIPNNWGVADMAPPAR